MKQPERGDVLMLETGELVVYDKIAHWVRRIPGCDQMDGDLSGPYFPMVALTEDVTRRCQYVGSLASALAGLAKLCAAPVLPMDEVRFLICKRDKISHATPFLTRADAQAWIDAEWGGGGGPDNPYWIAVVRAVAAETRKPWRYADEGTARG